MRPSLLWLFVAAAYVGFTAWYTGSRDPLTADEIDAYLAVWEERGRDPETLVAFRAFLEADDGGDFIVVNNIDLRDEPLRTGAVEPGESSEQVLDRYMAYMWPALLRRACHPVVAGSTLLTLESWGVEPGERYGSAGLMRYRSRRDMMEIATHPGFGDSHPYKEAAMSRTLAYAIEPRINLGDLRVVTGLLLFAVGALLHLAFARRRVA